MGTKKAKKKKKSLFSRGEYEVPSIVKGQTMRGFLIGGGIFLSGIVFAVVTKHFYMVMFGFLLGGAIALMNYIRELKLSKTGYKTLEGICVKVEYSILKKGQKNKDPKRFLVSAYSDFYEKETIFSLPYVKGGEVLEVNDKVIIYTENNPAYFVSLTDKNGYVGIGGLIGYTNDGFILPKKEEEDDISSSDLKTEPQSDFFITKH